MDMKYDANPPPFEDGDPSLRELLLWWFGLPAGRRYKYCVSEHGIYVRGRLVPGSDDGAPGRNEPCPCGSGRKYKKCCARC